jgi:hypothetical protein
MGGLGGPQLGQAPPPGLRLAIDQVSWPVHFDVSYLVGPCVVLWRKPVGVLPNAGDCQRAPNATNGRTATGSAHATATAVDRVALYEGLGVHGGSTRGVPRDMTASVSSLTPAPFLDSERLVVRFKNSRVDEDPTGPGARHNPLTFSVRRLQLPPVTSPCCTPSALPPLPPPALSTQRLLWQEHVIAVAACLLSRHVG